MFLNLLDQAMLASLYSSDDTNDVQLKYNNALGAVKQTFADSEYENKGKQKAKLGVNQMLEVKYKDILCKKASIDTYKQVHADILKYMQML